MQEKNVDSYKDLIVWQKSMDLVVEVYKLTRALPKEELYGLTSQLRRSAVSIPSNIAEGYGRNSTFDYIRFLQIAKGSLFELQTQLEICSKLEYLSKKAFESVESKTNEISKMLFSLIAKLKKSNA